MTNTSMSQQVHAIGSTCTGKLRAAIAFGGLVTVWLGSGWTQDVIHDPGRYVATQQATFIDGMNQRRLYRLVEVHCRDQLRRRELSDHERGELGTQLLRSIARQALNGHQVLNHPLWQRLAVDRQALIDAIDDPTVRGRVELAYLIARLAEARRLLESAPTSTDKDVRLHSARTSFQEVRRQLAALDEELRGLRASIQPGVANLQLRKLALLQRQLRFHQGEASVGYAACFASASSDEVSALTDALQYFRSVARESTGTELSWQSRLGLADCYRRLKDYAGVDSALQPLDKVDVPSAIQIEQQIIRAESSIDRGEPQIAANRLVQLLRDSKRSTAPDTVAKARVTLIKAYVGLWRSTAQQTTNATPQANANDWRALAVRQMTELEQGADAVWIRKAEAWIANLKSDGTDAVDIEILARTADNLLRRHETSEAAQLYLEASHLAQRFDQKDRALELGHRAVAIRYQAKQYDDVEAQAREIAMRYATLSEAAELHWLAVLSAAHRTRVEPSHINQYRELLAEHIRHWTDAPSTGNARLWLGLLLFAEGKRVNAIQQWREIDPVHEQFDKVLTRMRQGYLEELRAHQANSAKLATIRRDAGNYFHSAAERITASRAGEQPSAFIPRAARARLTSLEFRLLIASNDRPFDRHQKREEAWTDVATDEFPLQAHAVLGLQAALDGNYQSAAYHWTFVDWGDYEAPLIIANRLGSARTRATNVDRERVLERAQLFLLERLSATVPWSERADVHALYADVLVQADRLDRAIELLAVVTANKADPQFSGPMLGGLLVKYAQLLERRGQDLQDDHAHALTAYRRAVQSTPAASESWLDAKLGIARVLIHTGQSQRAHDSIQLVLSLYPDLPAERQQRFRQLLQATGR